MNSWIFFSIFSFCHQFTMTIRSPVEGSLRTLRNIEEAATSTASDKVDLFPATNETPAKTVPFYSLLWTEWSVNLSIFLPRLWLKETPGSTSLSPSKSMFQMRFESDNGSNPSVVVESSYSFSSEPNRSLVNSTQKSTASIVHQNSLKKRPLRWLHSLKKSNATPAKILVPSESSVAIAAAQPRSEED
jgi:hypothetical protein